ncbi:MAG: hypothetical protein J6A37_11490 [Oscillospiraceae bacterium]|nr:hypothetical protein [Oscillospiraceae bacterium]
MKDVYNYLNDNGFFKNDYQSEFTIEVEQKNEISLCKETAVPKKRKMKDKLLILLDELSDCSGAATLFGFVVTFAMSILTLLGYFENGDSDFLIGSIMSGLVSVLFGVMTGGSEIAERIYIKNKGLHKGQTLYTITYTNEIITIKLCGADVSEQNGEGQYVCELPEDYASYNNETALFYESELFVTPELAAAAIPELHNQRLIALSAVLKDKTDSFLSGDDYRKYAHKYYKLNLKRWFLGGKHHLYKFLTNKKSLVDFCEFIKNEKKEEAELAKKTSEQTEADNELIRDVIGDV